MKNVFIIGSKGIPSRYGGFETFVDKLTANKISNDIKYHVSCLSDTNEEFEYNNARCFNVKVPNIGPAKAILYDVLSLARVYRYIKTNKIENALVYILACRIGPLMAYFKKRFQDLGVNIYLNPDGHEWKRKKWNLVIRKYWKYSERIMVKNADLIVCDSQSIEEYIVNEYDKYKPSTTFISYGSNVVNKEIASDKYKQWLNKWNIRIGDYYLIVGRFVAENNYELIIKEYIKSQTNKKLVIVTNVEKNKLYNSLQKTTNFERDKRIKFVGTIYDQELLTEVRNNAFGYLHGHEVGGTNPSLLEAMATTPLNILLDVNFNKEVGNDGALYFSKENENLKKLINDIDHQSEDSFEDLEFKAKERIRKFYSWDKIVTDYERLFLKGKRSS